MKIKKILGDLLDLGKITQQEYVALLYAVLEADIDGVKEAAGLFALEGLESLTKED